MNPISKEQLAAATKNCSDVVPSASHSVPAPSEVSDASQHEIEVPNVSLSVDISSHGELAIQGEQLPGQSEVSGEPFDGIPLGHRYGLPIAARLPVSGFPDQPAPGSKAVPTTLANVAHLLSEHHLVPRYDCIKKRIQISVPDHRGTSDNLDSSVMTYIISLALLNGLQSSQVPSMVSYIADRNSYNPAKTWIESEPWDGVDRLPAFMDTVVAHEDYPAELKRVLLYKWSLSLVAAAIKPTGFKCRGVLTLQGPQYIGKTSWGRSLVNDPTLQEALIKLDHHLDGSNKDSVLGAISHWIVEIGELDSSFKKDIARLKGFLTSDYDKVRRPYARSESEYPRRTVFFATVNDHHFLVDSTGNSRWWTIPVTALNYTHNIDMQQLYAQLAVDLQVGAQWWLTQAEEQSLEIYNRQHRTVSVIRELLEEQLDLTRIGTEGLPAMTPIKLLKHVGIERPTNAQCKECSSILREWLGETKRINGENKFRIPMRVFVTPTTGFTPLQHAAVEEY